MGLAIFILLIVFVFVASSQNNKETLPGPHISMGTIEYPEVICDKCKEKVPITPNTIDMDTWDLICKCGHRAYLHPKREERQSHLDEMLNW